MKNLFNKSLRVTSYGFVVFCLVACLPACNRTTETVRTSSVSETIDGQQELKSKTVQTSRGPKGIIIEETVIKEKTVCVDRHGKRMKHNTYDQCIKAGGKIIEEETIGERRYENK